MSDQGCHLISLSTLLQLQGFFLVALDDLVTVKFSDAFWTLWSLEGENSLAFVDGSARFHYSFLVVKATLALKTKEALVAFLGVRFEI